MTQDLEAVRKQAEAFHARRKLEEQARWDADFATSATVTNGVVRWKSNNQVPPDEILAYWDQVGKPFSISASREASQLDRDAFFHQYRQNQKRKSPEQQAEEAFEMRAAFGPGVEVVNIITGKKTRT